MTPTLHMPTLCAIDRCDRCGAQAYVKVELAVGAELLFCAHHGRQYEDKLREVAITIHDETSRLTETAIAVPSEDVWTTLSP